MKNKENLGFSPLFLRCTKTFALLLVLTFLTCLSPRGGQPGVEASSNKGTKPSKMKTSKKHFPEGALNITFEDEEAEGIIKVDNRNNGSGDDTVEVSNSKDEIAFLFRAENAKMNQHTRFECILPPGENITRLLFVPSNHVLEGREILRCLQQPQNQPSAFDFETNDDQQSYLETCFNMQSSKRFYFRQLNTSLSGSQTMCYSSRLQPKPDRCRYIPIGGKTITPGLVLCQSPSHFVHDFLVLSPDHSKVWTLHSKMRRLNEFMRLRFSLSTTREKKLKFYLNEEVRVECDVPDVLYQPGSASVIGHYENGETFRIAQDGDSYRERVRVHLHQLQFSFRMAENMTSITCNARVLHPTLSWVTVQQTLNFTVLDLRSFRDLWQPRHSEDKEKGHELVYNEKRRWACNFTGSIREIRAGRKKIAENLRRQSTSKEKKSNYGENFVPLLRTLNYPPKANYTCQVLEDFVEQSSQSDFYLHLDPEPPSIERPRHEIWVLPRERNHTLDCNVKGEPKPSIRWLKNGKELWHTLGQWKVENTVAHLNTTTLPETLTSTSITSPDLEESLFSFVNFTCVASSYLGSTSLQFILVDSSKPVIMKKTEVLNDELVVMKYGEEQRNLTCQYQGGPLTEVLWLFNNKTRLAESDRKLGLNLSESSILLERINKSVEGNYTCIIYNDYGSDNYTFNLVVYYEKPQILNEIPQLTLNTLDENQNITCKFRGVPKPTVIWYHDGSPINESFSFNSTINDGAVEDLIFESVIEIPVVQSSDAGIYSCFVFNQDQDISSDSAQFNFTVTVTPPDLVLGTMSYTSFYATLASGGTILLLIVALIFGLICYWNARARSQYEESEEMEMEGNFQDSVQEFLERNPHLIEQWGLQLEVPVLIDLGNEYRISDVSELTLDKTAHLGGGDFGEVFQGEFRGSSVAVKVMTSSSKFPRWRSLLEEIHTMSVLTGDAQNHHKNIVKLLGFRIDPAGKDLQIVMELCLISLKKHLEKREEYFLTKLQSTESTVCRGIETTFAGWCSQIASGMAYLASKDIIHRDLAARNVLLSTDGVVKISDFGLSRLLLKQPNPRYYRLTQNRKVKIPQNWCAYESLVALKFTKESDVWMFGVCCWEIYTVGKEPFNEFPNWERDELVYQLKKGTRLEKPEFFRNHDKLYEILWKCWDLEPTRRPTFTELEAFFQSSLPYQTNTS